MSVTLGQKVEPEVRNKYVQLISQYQSDGRIEKKGELFGLVYNDHLEIEKKRVFLKSCTDSSKEIESHLTRILVLLMQAEEQQNSQFVLLEKSHSDALSLIDIRIKELETIIRIQKEQLEEKTLENHELRIAFEKLSKRDKKVNNKSVS